MRILWILGALAIASVAGALLFLERKIRLRTRRVLAEQPSADPRADRVVEMRMRHVSTGFADHLPLPALLEAPGEVEVFCTAQAVFVGAMIILLSSVEDASMSDGSLRVQWRRGEMLETVLEAPAHELERLRREIHLRQPHVFEKLLAMVQK